ncbi:hypothetical protein FAVG1_10534 [Fusarium avenaceum]|nr:hypothetical protein FAVG1_10534 [Fusarium avenaceum]
MAYRTAPSDEPTDAIKRIIKYMLHAPADIIRIAQDNLTSVIFGRLLLTIYDLPTALELCRKPMRILGTSYDVVSNETKCCNCAGLHPAWDQRCTNINSAQEHRNSAIRRQVGPEWGSLVNNPPPSKNTGKKQQTATAASTSLPSDSSSQETPLPSPQDTPPSMSPEAPTSTFPEDSTSTPQAAPKKPRGRPPKARAADLEQSTMTPPLSSQETPPSTSQATPKKPRGRPPKAQVADHLKQSSMHAFTIKQSAYTIVEPTPSSTTTMPGDSITEKPHSPSGTTTAKTIHDENLHEQVVVVRAGKRKSEPSAAIFDDINVAKKEEGSQGGSYRVNNDKSTQPPTSCLITCW